MVLMGATVMNIVDISMKMATNRIMRLTNPSQDNTHYPGNNQRDETSNQNQTTAETRTHTTRQADYVSLMVLPAVISNGTKTLKVNVMLDNCSTGSYVSDAAAEELTLQGKSQQLTISGTGGTEVKKHSRQVEVMVTSLDKKFSANLQANVLDNISGDTPAFEWSKLKKEWPTYNQSRSRMLRTVDKLMSLLDQTTPYFTIFYKRYSTWN